MRNLLAGLATIVIVVGAVGWGRGWYAVEGQPADLGKFAYRVEFDPAKAGGDVAEAFSFVKGKLSGKPAEVSEEK